MRRAVGSKEAAVAGNERQGRFSATRGTIPWRGHPRTALGGRASDNSWSFS